MATTAQPDPATTSETTAGPTTAKAWGTEASDQPLRPMDDRAPRAQARRRRDQDHSLRHLPQRPAHGRNDWGMSRYPIVPGHEIVGMVTGVGPDVTRYRVGDTRRRRLHGRQLHEVRASASQA